jgi:coatomer protein complex subunit gamma
MPDTVLLDVEMVVTPEDDGDVQLEEEFVIPAPKLPTNEPGTVYVSFKRLETESQYIAASFTNVLKFTSKEIDPSTGEPEDGDGYPDEYQVEDLDLNGADYVVPAYAGSFDNVWEQSNGDSATETLQLSNIKSISGTSLEIIQTHSVLTRSQMQQNNSPKLCHCNPLMAQTSRCQRQRTPSSSTARRSQAERWRRRSGWRLAQRLV